MQMLCLSDALLPSLTRVFSAQEWKEMYEKFFPAKPGESKAKFMVDPRYKEPGEVGVRFESHAVQTKEKLASHYKDPG